MEKNRCPSPFTAEILGFSDRLVEHGTEGNEKLETVIRDENEVVDAIVVMNAIVGNPRRARSDAPYPRPVVTTG